MSILSIVTRHPRKPATPPAVTVADRLKPANIVHAGSNFNRHFRNMKLRPDAPKTEVETYDLTTSALDKAIRAELPTNHVISIDTFLDLIEAQKNGQAGVLLVNDYANIVYIEDETGQVWAVRARFYSRYGFWDVGANSVSSPLEWDAGHRVVSGK